MSSAAFRPFVGSSRAVGRGAAPKPDNRPAKRVTYFKAGETRNSEDHEVYLDGRRVALCVEAMTSHGDRDGWARVYLTDDGGAIKRDGFDRPMTHIVYGRVALRTTDSRLW